MRQHQCRLVVFRVLHERKRSKSREYPVLPGDRGLFLFGRMLRTPVSLGMLKVDERGDHGAVKALDDLRTATGIFGEAADFRDHLLDAGRSFYLGPSGFESSRFTYPRFALG